MAPLVVALDFSQHSPALISHAWKTAVLHACDVHFLHVIHGTSLSRQNLQFSQSDALNALQAQTGLPRGEGAESIKFTHVVRIGAAAREIIDYARECSAGMILLGTHGRGGLAHLVLGSVAESVVRDAPCPVLIVPDQVAQESSAEPTPPVDTMVPDEVDSFALLSGQEANLDSNRVVELLVHAIQWRATDIHIDAVGPDRVWIRFRVDGKLRTFCRLDRRLADPLLMQLKLMSDLDTTQTFAPQEARLRLPVSMESMEVRVTIVPAMDGDAVALRLLKHETLPRPLGSLGLSESTLDSVHAMLQHRPGLVLVTGPTGTGKTTTVYAMLQTLGPGDQNIVSIEDPVEYRVPGIRQLSVNARHDLTMTRGLRTLLRMDPDVVFIGEIRDVEALEIAMRASSSGRYVFSTLHTRDVASTVTALRDLHADNYSLAANLTGIISQRLIRCLCRQCRHPRPLAAEELDLFQSEGVEAPAELFEPKGCTACQGSGYRDRIGVFEAVVTNDEIVSAIQRGAPEDELRRTIRDIKFHSLFHNALTKVRAGITDLTEARSLGWM